MLEQIIRFEHAVQNNEPKYRVKQFYEEYTEAYKKIHVPKQRHMEKLKELFFIYNNYMNRKDIK
jgi:hypothetical protein